MTPRDYLREPYARVVMPDETGGYYAEILEFPGCFAEGDSVEDTYKELENAAESWIEVRLSQGQEIPAPSSNLDYSGTISLRLPRSIHKRAAVMAERDKTSLNTYLVTAVAEKVGAQDLYNALAQRMEHRMAQSAYQAIVDFTSAPMPTAAGNTFRQLKIEERGSTITPNNRVLIRRR